MTQSFFGVVRTQTPFLIGVQRCHYEVLNGHMGDVVVADLDSGEVRTNHPDDIESFPQSHLTNLRVCIGDLFRTLSTDAPFDSDALYASLRRFFAKIIGHYEQHFVSELKPTGKISVSFDPKSLAASRPRGERRFLERLCATQSFQHFVQARCAELSKNYILVKTQFDVDVEAEYPRDAFTFTAAKAQNVFKKVNFTDPKEVISSTQSSAIASQFSLFVPGPLSSSSTSSVPASASPGLSSPRVSSSPSLSQQQQQQQQSQQQQQGLPMPFEDGLPQQQQQQTQMSNAELIALLQTSPESALSRLSSDSVKWFPIQDPFGMEFKSVHSHYDPANSPLKKSGGTSGGGGEGKLISLGSSVKVEDEPPPPPRPPKPSNLVAKKNNVVAAENDNGNNTKNKFMGDLLNTSNINGSNNMNNNENNNTNTNNINNEKQKVVNLISFDDDDININIDNNNNNKDDIDIINPFDDIVDDSPVDQTDNPFSALLQMDTINTSTTPVSLQQNSFGSFDFFETQSSSSSSMTSNQPVSLI